MKRPNIRDEVSQSRAERAIFLSNALERGECLVAQMQGAVLEFVVLNYGFFGFGIPLIVVRARHRGFGVESVYLKPCVRHDR